MLDGKLVDGGVAAQTAQTMENVAGRLAEAGAALSDVVKTLCFLTDMGTFAEFNEAYAAAFGDHRPARSTVEVVGAPGRHGRRGRGLGVQAGRDATTAALRLGAAARSYVAYHDDEWGVPQRDPLVLFEFIVLEGAQAGLSWRRSCTSVTGYRAAFAGFDPLAVAAFAERRRRAVPGRRRHRPQPGQDHRGDRQRTSVAGARRPGRPTCGASSTARPIAEPLRPTSARSRPRRRAIRPR